MIAFLTEFVGTFVFIVSMLIASAYHPPVFQPIVSAVALLGMLYFAMYTSGGHFNPAVSTMLLVKGDLTVPKYVGYVAAQILGGLLALLWFQYTIKNKPPT